jgi:cytoskeletal protein CcmA (bactofilin family)
MSEIRESVEDENKIETVIAEDITLKGRLVFKKSLKIKGKFEGRVESDGHLIIGQESEISANVTSARVSVFGKLNGKVKATQRIELHHNSQTCGDLITPDISIEKGSIFNGSCIMSTTKQAE